MSVTSKTLFTLGFSEGKEFGEALKLVKTLEASGLDDDAVIQALTELQLAKPQPLEMTAPKEVAIAMQAETPEECDNLNKVLSTMSRLSQSPVISGIAVMPDACPAGGDDAAITVGGAIAVENAIVPYSTSADLCCSMHATFFQLQDHSQLSIANLMDSLQASTRFGAGGRKPHELVYHEVIDENVWNNPFLSGLQSYAKVHMADQGDGNHFAYLGVINPKVMSGKLSAAGYDELAVKLSKVDQCFVFVTHHGSRGLGAQVYKRGLAAAVGYTAKVAKNIPKAAAWLDFNTKEGQDYWDALQYVSRWTLANHQSIHTLFLQQIKGQKVADFGNQHNFCWVKPTPDNNGTPQIGKPNIFLHGKGATPAWKDQIGRPLLGLIPLNMASNILIVLGANNEKYLSFAPHGAGRNLSRSQVTKGFKDDQGEVLTTAVKKSIEQQTKGLDIRWFNGTPDISESPLGYKNADSIKKAISTFKLAEVIGEIRPLGCIMAGSAPIYRGKRQSRKELRKISTRAERRNAKQHIMDDLLESEDDQ